MLFVMSNEKTFKPTKPGILPTPHSVFTAINRRRFAMKPGAKQVPFYTPREGSRRSPAERIPQVTALYMACILLEEPGLWDLKNLNPYHPGDPRSARG